MLALFVGGLVLSVGLLAGAGQAAGGFYLLAELIAVALFVGRVLRHVGGVDFVNIGPARHVGAAAIWVLVALLLFMYLVAMFIAAPDPEALPINVLVGSDHATYIGVVTNLVIAMLLLLEGSEWRAGRRPISWPSGRSMPGSSCSSAGSSSTPRSSSASALR
jgi:hypothetical protein